jgi:Alkylmercury lyase
LNDDFDFLVRRELYDATIRSGTVPQAANVASALGADVWRINESFARLAAGHVIVLGDDGSIMMAAPFAGVPTLFRVTVKSVSYFANCIWDALGVAAMLHSDAVIETRCDDCGDSSTVVVDHGNASGDGIVHFAIPAHRWWDNIVFT